jgi:hypothetical protein
VSFPHKIRKVNWIVILSEAKDLLSLAPDKIWPPFAKDDRMGLRHEHAK